MAKKLVVEYGADTDELKRKLKDVDDSHSSFASSLGKVGKAGAAAFAGIAVAAGAGMMKAIQAGSDLNETISKVAQITGPASQGVTDFANAMASGFGIAKNESLNAVAGIASIGKASGLTQVAAADMGTHFTKLGADLSSFANIPMTDALGAIQSGLVGEAEPLRKFGVLLSEAAVQSEALALGLVKPGVELTEQQKVMARSSLITKGLSDASGDLERTQGSLANQMRTLKGNFVNAAAEMGQAFLPAASAILGSIGPVIPQIADTMKGIMPAIMPVIDAISAGLGPAIKVIGTAFASLGPAIQALMPAFTTLSTVLGTSLGAVFTALGPVITKVAEAFGKILIALSPLIEMVADVLVVALKALEPVIEPLTDVILELAGYFIDTLKAIEPIIEPVLMLASSIMQALLPAIKPLLPLFGMLVREIFSNKSIMQSLIGIVESLAGVVVALSPILTIVAKIIAGVLTAAVKIVVPIIGGLANVIEAVANAIEGVIRWIGKMADKLSKIKLPEWLKPGSPSPFEISLWGTARAMQNLVRRTPESLGFGVKVGTEAIEALSALRLAPVSLPTLAQMPAQAAAMAVARSAGRTFNNDIGPTRGGANIHVHVHADMNVDGNKLGNLMGEKIAHSIRLKTGLRS